MSLVSHDIPHHMLLLDKLRDDCLLVIEKESRLPLRYFSFLVGLLIAVEWKGLW
jgi:hypothetical protein